VPGASRAGHDYLVALTIDRELPGSLAFAIDRYGNAARAVRDQLSVDTWMILAAVDRALAGYPAGVDDLEAELSDVHSRTLAGLLALSGIDGESLIRDTGWHVRDIGKRIERGLAMTALLSAALTKRYPEQTEREVTDWVLRATESSVSYRRRHQDSVRLSNVAELLLFDTANPRSLAYQLERLHADFHALPGASASSRPQRLLADASPTPTTGAPNWRSCWRECTCVCARYPNPSRPRRCRCRSASSRCGVARRLSNDRPGRCGAPLSSGASHQVLVLRGGHQFVRSRVPDAA
jgi:uncharacterized alpha-E superfamily protein